MKQGRGDGQPTSTMSELTCQVVETCICQGNLPIVQTSVLTKKIDISVEDIDNVRVYEYLIEPDTVQPFVFTLWTYPYDFFSTIKFLLTYYF